MSRRFRLAIPLSVPLMILAIIGIAGFQVYWMRKLYGDEWTQLKKETDIAFRDVVYKLQMQQFEKDSIFIKHDLPPNLFLFNVLDSMRDASFADTFNAMQPGDGKRKMTIAIQEFNERDSNGMHLQGRLITADSGSQIRDLLPSRDSARRRMRTRLTSEPPLSVAEIDSAYRVELVKNQITVPFRIDRIQGPPDQLERLTPPDKLKTNFLFIGFSKAYAFQASFGSPVRYILGRMVWPIAIGLALLGFTVMAFVVLYRNLQQQQRLAQYKNDFISNMTHELKTPISTIKVAVEALRHFDALDDPRRTKEYLEISALELQRLSMLVDKVLRLSEFENKVIGFHLTTFDLRELAAEVIDGMRLSFEKAGAVVQLTGAGAPFDVRADREHLSSVISNLLDNALKYSKEGPVITVQVRREEGMVILSVTDNGIGIPAAWQDRIFEKFFRVPSGDHHNIKGYGLGLNYVHHILSIHKGSIGVESKEGKGSTFTVKLPAI